MAARPEFISRPSSVAAAKRTIVLVTGGNAGIGLQIVASLCALPNYQVLMGCRDTSKGEAACSSLSAPSNVNPIQLDITNDHSIEHCFLTVQQMFGKLDVLVNNAGTSGRELGESKTPRQAYDHIFNVNVTSTALLTDKLTPLLEKSKEPKVIFLSSSVGSIQTMLDGPSPPLPYPAYGSSKAALNYLTCFYAKEHPKWKVNAVCPGLRATGLSGADLNEQTDPKLGAVRVTQLAKEGPDGVTGTYSNTEGVIPW